MHIWNNMEISNSNISSCQEETNFSRHSCSLLKKASKSRGHENSSDVIHKHNGQAVNAAS